MATTYKAKVIATQAKNGPLVAPMTVEEAGVLAANYLADYSNFLRLIDTYVNHELYTLEEAQPEGTPMNLVIPGLGGHAVAYATAIDQQYQMGKIQVNGQKIVPWPGASQIAYASDANTMVLQWIKEEWQAWVLVGVMVAVLAYVVVNQLRGSQYTMTGYTATTATGTTGTTALPSAGGILVWAGDHWELLAVIGLGLAAAPFVVRSLAHTEEGVNELHAAEQGATGGGY